MTEKIGSHPRPGVESKPAGAQAPKHKDDSASVDKAQRTGPEAGSRDAVSLTETATRLQVIEARLGDLPDVDRERVESLRALIDAGEYEINAQQIARKLAELEQLLY